MTKQYKVIRGLRSYIVEAETRSKAKYKAYKAYAATKRKPKAFLPWVYKVRGVYVIGYISSDA